VALRGEDREEGEGQEGSWESNGDGDSDAKLLSNRLNRELIGGGGVEPSLTAGCGPRPQQRRRRQTAAVPGCIKL